METRANHMIVGLFVLGLVAAGFGFVKWSVGQGMGSTTAVYRILFDGPVSGLAPGANVLFNGIKVGTVETIGIYPKDSRQVEVAIRVRQGTPVRTDSLASVAQVGITGLASVQITAGEPKAALLVSAVAGEPALLKAKPMLSGSIMDAMPEVLANINGLFVRLNRIIDSNESILSSSMDSIRSFTTVLDKNKNEFGAALTNVRLITESFRKSAEQLEAMIGKVDGDLLNGDKSIVAQAKLAMQAVRAVAEKLDKTIGDNANQIAIVAKRSLGEFELLARDGRRAARSLDRILDRVERNPQSFLFGDKTVRQYKPQ